MAAAACGGLALLAALAPPLDALAEQSVAAHMVQHLLLMVVAAPLLVLADPLTASVRILPTSARARVAPVLGSARRWGRRPVLVVTAAALHAVVLVGWHVPVAYTAAARQPVLHAVEHLHFLLTGLVFWWCVREATRRRRGPELAAGGIAVAVVAAAGLGVGLLMTFATSAWYAGYRGVEQWGMSALEDQQAAGALMWAAGGPVYVLALLALLGAVLKGGRGDADDRLRPPVSVDAAR